MSNRKKIIIGVAVGGSVLALAGLGTFLAVKLSKKKTEEQTKEKTKEQSKEKTRDETVVTKDTKVDALPEAKQVALKSGTYLSMWNSSLSCSATKVGDSETFDLLKSSTVSGAHVIQNKQGRYLSCSPEGILSVSAVAGIQEAWFVKNINVTGLIQSYDGYYLSKSALSSTTTKATKGTGDYFSVVYVSSIKDETVVVSPPTSSKIITISVNSIRGKKYISISSAGWVSCTATSAGMDERFYVIPVPSASAVSGHYICTMDGRYLVGDQQGKLSMSAGQTDWGVWSVSNIGLQQGGQIYSVKGRYNLVCDMRDETVKTSSVIMVDPESSTLYTKVLST